MHMNAVLVEARRWYWIAWSRSSEELWVLGAKLMSVIRTASALNPWAPKLFRTLKNIYHFIWIKFSKTFNSIYYVFSKNVFLYCLAFFQINIYVGWTVEFERYLLPVCGTRSCISTWICDHGIPLLLFFCLFVCLRYIGILYTYVYKYFYLCIQCTTCIQCPHRPDEGTRSPLTTVTEDLHCHAGAGNWTWVLQKRSQCS